jgi:hypothetical protein
VQRSNGIIGDTYCHLLSLSTYNHWACTPETSIAVLENDVLPLGSASYFRAISKHIASKLPDIMKNVLKPEQTHDQNIAKLHNICSFVSGSEKQPDANYSP